MNTFITQTFKKPAIGLVLALLLSQMLVPLSPAEAKSCWRDGNGRLHCNAGSRYRRGNDGAFFDWKTKKILKGGLVGAGVGTGAALLTDKPLGKTAVLGAGIGAGTQAVRYSKTLRRHPVLKTAAYGGLAGAGVGHFTRSGSIGKGALWGSAIGAGVGVLRD